jgi:hypothetical protein
VRLLAAVKALVEDPRAATLTEISGWASGSWAATGRRLPVEMWTSSIGRSNRSRRSSRIDATAVSAWTISRGVRMASVRPSGWAKSRCAGCSATQRALSPI